MAHPRRIDWWAVARLVILTLSAIVAIVIIWGLCVLAIAVLG